MIEQICNAIDAKFNADNGFRPLLTGGLWFTQAPESVTSPFAVYYYSGDNREEIMGDVNSSILTAELQFNIFSESTVGGYELSRLAEKLDAMLNWQSVNINDYKIIRSQKISNQGIIYVDEIWQTTVIYELELIKE